MRGAQAALHALTGLRSGLYEEDAIGSHPDVHVSGGPDGADSSYVSDARLVSSPRGMDVLASTDRSGADFTFGEKQHDSWPRLFDFYTGLFGDRTKLDHTFKAKRTSVQTRSELV